jgi:hypothetical protein
MPTLMIEKLNPVLSKSNKIKPIGILASFNSLFPYIKNGFGDKPEEL